MIEVAACLLALMSFSAVCSVYLSQAILWLLKGFRVMHVSVNVGLKLLSPTCAASLHAKCLIAAKGIDPASTVDGWRLKWFNGFVVLSVCKQGSMLKIHLPTGAAHVHHFIGS